MASSLPKGNAVIGQSGGPTAVINQSLVGVIEGLKNNPAIGKILGARHAVRGVVKSDYVDLRAVDSAKLERVANTPSSALGSSRDKPDAAYCARILESLSANEVRYFFYIGGNDSSDTCRIVSELAQQSKYELRCFHVPKTIDNDLVHNDHTPGFGSAAKFVAQAFMGDNLDNASLPGIKVNIIMGRHAGYLTAASVLARKLKQDGPHLIYVPEVAFDLDKFYADVDRVYKKIGRCVIAVSEGVHDKDGTPMMTKLAPDMGKDAHGNAQLSGTGALGDYLANAIKKNLGEKLRVRADTFGYLQRSFAGCTSEADAQEARQAGREAAKAALEGHSEGSIAIQRAPGSGYDISYKRFKLSDIAAKTKHLDTAYVVDGCDIAESFVDYVAPIVGPLPVIDAL
jgi:ATP-dependent phosphofructokinase / diphosphate-dependent phosphofructokinase